jgi:hypothetical protein
LSIGRLTADPLKSLAMKPQEIKEKRKTEAPSNITCKLATKKS